MFGVRTGGTGLPSQGHPESQTLLPAEFWCLKCGVQCPQLCKSLPMAVFGLERDTLPCQMPLADARHHFRPECRGDLRIFMAGLKCRSWHLEPRVCVPLGLREGGPCRSVLSSPHLLPALVPSCWVDHTASVGGSLHFCTLKLMSLIFSPVTHDGP